MMDWSFSLANAIFSIAMMLIWSGVHIYKMHKLRMTIEKTLSDLISEIAPIPGHLKSIGESFLSERLGELENRVEEVQVRLQHVESMIEASQGGV